MALATITTKWPTVEVDGTGGSIEIPREAQFYHTGFDTSGTATTDIIVLGRESMPASADYSAEDDKVQLRPGATFDARQGTYYMKSAGASVALNVIVE